MAKDKQPPPDHPGNIRGRISALKSLARIQAKAKVKAMGGNYDAALKTRLTSLGPQLKKLRARLKKVSGKAAPATPSKRKTKIVPAPKSVAVPAGSDLLSQLSGL